MPLRDGHIQLRFLHWYWVLIHWVAAVFCYLLCRDLNCGVVPSIVGGSVFAFVGYIGWAGTPYFLTSSLWFPLVLLFFAPARASSVTNDAARLLPDKIDSFQALNPTSAPGEDFIKRVNAEDVGRVSSAARAYRDDGPEILIEVVKAESDSAAYALLTRLASGSEIKTDIVGIASAVLPDGILFYKADALVHLSARSSAIGQARLMELARGFAATARNGSMRIQFRMA